MSEPTYKFTRRGQPRFGMVYEDAIKRIDGLPAKLAYVALTIIVDRNDGRATGKGVRTLAKIVNVAPSTMRKGLISLEEQGIIAVTPGSQGEKNQYDLFDYYIAEKAKRERDNATEAVSRGEHPTGGGVPQYDTGVYRSTIRGVPQDDTLSENSDLTEKEEEGSHTDTLSDEGKKHLEILHNVKQESLTDAERSFVGQAVARLEAGGELTHKQRVTWMSAITAKYEKQRRDERPAFYPFKCVVCGCEHHSPTISCLNCGEDPNMPEEQRLFAVADMQDRIRHSQLSDPKYVERWMKLLQDAGMYRTDEDMADERRQQVLFAKEEMERKRANAAT